MASNKVENLFLIATVGALAYYAYRVIKSDLEKPPEPTYEPASYEAALFMDSSPNYDYELPSD